MTNASLTNTVPAATTPSAAKPAAARTRLLLEGSIVATLLRLAAPNVVVNVVLIAVTATVDAHFVGRMGPQALAGLSLVFPLIMLMQQMANSSMGGAIASAIARAIGAGRHADASALVVHGIIIAVAMAAISSAVLLLGGPAIYRLMGGSGETRAAALEYSNAIFAGALAYWLLSTLTSVVRGAGQAAVLALVYIAAEALHIALVPLLMFGIGPLPPLGIAGAGIATVTSFTASSAILFWYVASGRTAIQLTLRGMRLDRRLFIEILRVGAPMSLQPSSTIWRLPRSRVSSAPWARCNWRGSASPCVLNICSIPWRSVWAPARWRWSGPISAPVNLHAPRASPGSRRGWRLRSPEASDCSA
jgi:Na+-driven multidrug efflux pump